jgi:putative membrane protein
MSRESIVGPVLAAAVFVGAIVILLALVDFDLPEHFVPGLIGTLVYGGVGIVLAVLGFKVFDWLSPRIDIQRELAEKQNIAVAVVCAAIILGVSYIVAQIVQ